ncbi:hypothetical protein [Acidocella sp.]|uniref:hypothetical protein n=1 Tax=Acidocella sp. TaxID=50710 RepID=UPI003D035E16
MIPIAPDIIGPGIEEEYADAMERIVFLLDHTRHSAWRPGAYCTHRRLFRRESFL